MHDSTDDDGRTWYGPGPEDQARIEKAREAQERMIAALPAFPRWGFYVKTGLAGYGPDLEPDDMPAASWEDVAGQVAWELRSAAEFSHEGAIIRADQAREAYDRVRSDYFARTQAGNWQAVADTYHEAWADLRLGWELDSLASTFESLANAGDPAPLYQGRPELRHARIWDLVAGQFPYDISHNSRLYVWECEEDPGEEGS